VETTLNTKVLIMVALLLVGVKFVLMPVIDWQNQTIEQIEQVERRNLKSQKLLSKQDELLVGMAAADKKYREQKETFPSYVDSTMFRLETQIKYENLLKSHGLRQSNFFWRGDQDEQVFGSLYKGRFNVSFNGKLKQFAILHSKLAEQMREYKVLNYNAGVQMQKQQSMGAVNATLTIDAYYWLGEG